jgi:hypothetical protein
VARIAQAGLQRSVVGEQQQALAVVVEPPRGIDAGHRNEIGERHATGDRAELAQDPIGLVEQQQAHTLAGLLWHHSPPDGSKRHMAGARWRMCRSARQGFEAREFTIGHA